MSPLKASWLAELIITWWGPRYDCTALHEIITKQMGELTLKDTLTGLLVPAFDVRNPGTFLFSSFHKVLIRDQQLKDICIATTAAPTYFRPYCIIWPPIDSKTTDPHQIEKDTYELIDGGIAANNPSLHAIWNIVMRTRQRQRENTAAGHPDHVLNLKDCIVISVGTGGAVRKQGYTAEECGKWGAIGWLKNGSYNPLIDMLTHANAKLIYTTTAFLFHLQGCEGNFLRIEPSEEHNKALKPMDDTSTENMHNLIRVGKDLLEAPLSRIDFTKGVWKHEHILQGDTTNKQGGSTSYNETKETQTNEKELERFAKILSEERKKRLENQKMEGQVKAPEAPREEA
ncbi:hypothetical protein BS78_06G031200 [Paspalum vaginatum]|nr:hypothetical protein BS78_06G031200 [Paspalum vaginatum]KAJ1270129.1 hypothetical protein BS78_06G031200 [Paspalum vaginatum]KAJ1270130.1 hypothetical protein BS78_06G031200 [Paspalum vaginatum]